jgi:multisubunit Na+/H+ antiporter MnhC subunit
MKLFLYELKKIWRLPLLLITAAVTLMYGSVFAAFFIGLPYNWDGYGSYLGVQAEVLTDLQAEYGEYLTTADRIDAVKFFDIYAELPADERLVQIGGGFSWQRNTLMNQFFHFDWLNLSAFPLCCDDGECDESPKCVGEYREFVDVDMSRFFNWRTYAHCCCNVTFDSIINPLGASAVEHLQNEYSGRGFCISQSLFPTMFYTATSQFFSYLMILAIILTAISLLPVITRDRRSNMSDLQFSSRKGRRLMRTQFAAAMTSAFMLAVVIIGGFTTAFLVSNADMFGMFYNQKAATGQSAVFGFQLIPWFDITYAQYVALFVGISVAVVMAAAAVFWFLSVYSRDYVQLLLKAIPLTVALCILGRWTVRHLLIYGNHLYQTIQIIGIEFIVSGVLLAVGSGLCVFACKRAMRRDLLT